MKTKKKHVGLTIFLIFLAILILLPVGAYIYLSADHFDVQSRKLPLDGQTPYAGQALLRGDGLTELPLEQADLVWLLQQSGKLDALPEQVKLAAAAVEVHPQGVTVDVLAKAFGWLPLPLRLALDVAPEEQTLAVAIRQIRLGKWIEIPAEMLARFGLQERYEIRYDELIQGADVRGMRLDDDHITLTIAFFDRMVQETFGSSKLAEVLMLYGAEDAVLQTAAEIYRTEPEAGQSLYAQALRQTEQAQLPNLFALTNPEQAKQFLATLNDFEQRFLLQLKPEAVDEAATQLQEDWVIPMNTRLTALLDGLRDQYRELHVKLATGGYMDAETDALISAARLCPDAGFDDADWHPILLRAADVRRAPMTADMPMFEKIPKEVYPAELYGKMPCDIGWMGKMPDGSYAIVYYFSTGELCIHALPSETGAAEFEQYRVPALYDLDGAVFPETRPVHEAPAEGLTKYVVFLPHDIDTAYQK